MDEPYILRYPDPSPQHREEMFQMLAIQLLWMILMTLLGKKQWAMGEAPVLRVSVLTWTDTYGNQSAEAPSYRRERTYPGPNYNAQD